MPESTEIPDKADHVNTSIWSDYNKFACAFHEAFEKAHPGLHCPQLGDLPSGFDMEDMVSTLWDEAYNQAVEEAEEW